MFYNIPTYSRRNFVWLKYCTVLPEWCKSYSNLYIYVPVQCSREVKVAYLRFTLDSHALMQWRWNKWLQGRCELVSMTTKEAKHIEQGARSSALNYKIYVITNLIKYIIIISILYSIIIIILYFWYNINKHINKLWSID